MPNLVPAITAFILSISTFSLVAFAQSTVPVSATGAVPEEIHLQLAKDYLQGFNSKDLEYLKKFAENNLSVDARHGLPPEKMALREIFMRRQIGSDLEIFRIEQNTSNQFVAVLRTRGEFPDFARQKWTFDTGSPTVITQRQLQLIAAPAGAMGARITAGELARDVDAKLSRMTLDDTFSGVILIAKDGHPVWQKAYGFADREKKIPNTLDTRFRLGSMNKMFTAASICQLVQSGKLKFTDTLASVLPDYPNQEVAKKITIHQLLTHTSGLGDIFNEQFESKKDSLHDVRDYLQLFVDKPLRFEPGTSWSYSNAGFIVLGLVIEKLSGQSYYDYVQQHIYDVAKMNASGSIPKTERPEKLATGYMRDDNGKWIANWNTLPWRGMSAGGGDSTAGDLLRFDQALRNHKLLNAELTETVMTAKVNPNPDSQNDKYAYGFEDKLVGPHRVTGHSGGAPGMNSELNMFLDNGYTVVVLSNVDPPAGQHVASYIRERLN